MLIFAWLIVTLFSVETACLVYIGYDCDEGICSVHTEYSMADGDACVSGRAGWIFLLCFGTNL